MERAGNLECRNVLPKNRRGTIVVNDMVFGYHWGTYGYCHFSCHLKGPMWTFTAKERKGGISHLDTDSVSYIPREENESLAGTSPLPVTGGSCLRSMPDKPSSLISGFSFCPMLSLARLR